MSDSAQTRDSVSTIQNTQRKPLPQKRAATEERYVQVPQSVLEVARRWKPQATPRKSPFDLPEFPPGVVPKETPTLAQDEEISGIIGWGSSQYTSDAYTEGVTFLGYSYLSVLAQRPEYRVVSEEIASEMTREWIEIKTKGDESKDDRVQKLGEACERFKVREVFRKAAEHDGLFGIGHIYLDTGDGDKKEELTQSIGDGSNAASVQKISKGKLKRLTTIEPVWCYPNKYESSNPLSPNWYRPETWFVMGSEVHASRLLSFVGREVPDMLKPAYAFGGLAMTQMLKPYVDNWLRARTSVSDLLHSFSVFVLKTNLGPAIFQAGGQALFNRIDFFNAVRDNRGVMALDKETEDFSNVSASLAGLHELQAQAQEHMASISRIPLVKLLGIQPSGLNASSEGEIRSFYDWIKAFQNQLFRDNLKKVLDFIQLSEFGDVDEEVTFDFIDLWQLDAEKKAAVQAQEAQTHAIYLENGVVGPEEVREAIARDKDSPYAGLDLDETPPPQPPEPPDMGGGMGPGGEAPIGHNGGPPLDGGTSPAPPGGTQDWSGKAQTIFAEKPLVYWAAKAKDLFGEREAALWTDRARALLKDPQANPDGPWLRKLAAMVGAKQFDDSAEGLWSRLARQKFRGDLGPDEEPDAEDAAPGSFSEEQHPRDPSGKFAKAGTASGKLVKQLKAHGYEKHPDFPGSEIYQHPSGHHIAFKPPPPSNPGGAGSTSFKHLPPLNVGKPSKVMFSAGPLQKLLDELHGSNVTQTPTPSNPKANDLPNATAHLGAAQKLEASKLEGMGFKYSDTIGGSVLFKKEGSDLHVALHQTGDWSLYKSGAKIADQSTHESPSSEISWQEHAGPGDNPAHVQPFGPEGLKPPKGIDTSTAVELSSDHVQYYGPDGETLDLWDDGFWKLEGESGEGQETLNAAFEALHPRGEGGEFIGKEGEPKPKQFSTLSDAGSAAGEKLVNEYGWTAGDTPNSKGSYIFSSPDGNAKVFIREDGSWAIYGKDGLQINQGDDPAYIPYFKFPPTGKAAEAAAGQPESKAWQTSFDPVNLGMLNALKKTYNLSDPVLSASGETIWVGGSPGHPGLLIDLATGPAGGHSWKMLDDDSNALMASGTGLAAASTALKNLPETAEPIQESSSDITPAYAGIMGLMAKEGWSNPAVGVWKNGATQLSVGKAGSWSLSENGKYIAQGQGAEALKPHMGAPGTVPGAAQAAAKPKPGAHHPDPTFMKAAAMAEGGAGWTWKKAGKTQTGTPATSYGLSNGGKLVVYNSGMKAFVYNKDGTLAQSTQGKYNGMYLAKKTLFAAAKEAAGSTPSTPPPAPTLKVGSIGKPLDQANLTKVGEQKGSNPGGVYQDPQGQKYYVKQTKSPDHAKNELLAASLYQLAGSPTLDYHPVGENGVATKWQNLKADNVSQLTDSQKAFARKQFATHAWLANWDAAGLQNDNIGVNEQGVPVSLDLGGALEYRAQGAPKGALFGPEVTEWNTLRSSLNPTAQALFGKMTPAELVESASQVAKITDPEIHDRVKSIYGNTPQADALAQRLIARRNDIIAQSKAEYAKSQGQTQPPTPAGPQYAKPYQISNSSWDSTYKARIAAAPKPSVAEGKAISDYSGSMYDPLNKSLRSSFGKNAGSYSNSHDKLSEYLAKASFPETATVRRRVSDTFAKHLMEEALSHAEAGEAQEYGFVDHGYASTDHWGGSLTIEITVPKGARAAAIGPYSHHPGENEILIAAGSKYRIDHYDPATKTMKATLVRSGPAKGGIWHVASKGEK